MSHLDPTTFIPSGGLRIEPVGAAGFAALREPWQRLLTGSGADPLFMSWDWLWLWWSCFGASGQLRLLQARDDAGTLVGIAPLWERRGFIKRLLPVRRLLFIGNRWREDGHARTEYTDFICNPAFRSGAVRQFMDFLAAQPGWNELIISDLRADSPTLPLLLEYAGAQGWLTRTAETLTSYRIDLREGFGAYLARRDASVRRRLFNKRPMLAEASPRHMLAQSSMDIERIFGDLNTLHAQRWGVKHFTGALLDFHRQCAARHLATGTLVLETLHAREQPLSMIYDLRAGHTEYNIQMGFDSRFDSRLSPGLLHLGAAMERAGEAGLQWFDLLAGGGKAGDYKVELADEHIPVISLQLVRSRWLQTLYRHSDARGTR